MALMGSTQVALRNTFLKLKIKGDDDFGVYAVSCPDSLEYQDLTSPEVGHSSTTTMNCEHDSTGIVSAPADRLAQQQAGTLPWTKHITVLAPVASRYRSGETSAFKLTNLPQKRREIAATSCSSASRHMLHRWWDWNADQLGQHAAHFWFSWKKMAGSCPSSLYGNALFAHVGCQWLSS